MSTQYVTNANQSTWTTTYKLLYNYLGFENSQYPLPYDIWMELPDDRKAAVLFVQWYDTIMLAWYKQHNIYAEEDTAVETMLQYLIKNVPIMESDPKRYSVRYVYKVAYNCLYCVREGYLWQRNMWECEQSNIVSSPDGTELNLFDIFVSKNAAHDEYSRSTWAAEFYEILDDMKRIYKRAEKLFDKILDTGALPGRMTAEDHEIIEELKIRLRNSSLMD